MVISGYVDKKDDVDLDLGLTTSVEILMDLDGTWSNLAPLPAPRFYLQAVTLKNIVYAIGNNYF